MGERKITGRHASLAEPLEPRRLMAAVPAAAAPLDGAGNNVANPTWGAVGQTLIRVAPAAYADGVSAPAGPDRPSAREVSNVLSKQLLNAAGQLPVDPRFMTALVYAWGQFIDHDVSFTDGVPGDGRESFDILVPKGDPEFDPKGTGTKVIPLGRSEFDPATGTGEDNPRQQFNEITAFLDGSVVYGSDPARAAALRAFVGGRLRTSDGGLLPYNTQGFKNQNEGPTPGDQMFLAGDARANENIELTALHVLFVREHNRLAAQYAAADPSLIDQQLYEKARATVAAQLQAITYNEFLPALLGGKALKPYKGYNPNVNPGITNEFSTAAYRVGHTMLGDDVEFLDDNGDEVADEVPLSGAFFNPELVRQNGVDSIIKYLASDPAKFVDAQLVDSVRNFLFGPPGAGGFDLAALNVQRGRDHGLADFNTTRVAFGLPRYASFAEINPDPAVQAGLAQLYGTVDNIDLWTGGLVEAANPAGGSVGETFGRIIADQFQRLRDGDRFWYRRVFKGAERKALERTTLADIVKRNTALTNLQDDLFTFNATVSGRVFLDANGNGLRDLREKALRGVRVDVLGDDGGVLETVMTDKKGRYSVVGIHEVGDVTIQCLGGGEYTSNAPQAKRVKVTKSELVADYDFFLVPAARPTPPA